MADEICCKRAVEAYRAGKSWRKAALENGLSEPISRLGAAGARKAIKAIDQAFAAIVKNSPNKPEELKALSIQRLAESIERNKPSGVVREIEVLGRFKEHDWFVRLTDVNIGVFTALGEAGPAIDAVATEIPDETTP